MNIAAASAHHEARLPGHVRMSDHPAGDASRGTPMVLLMIRHGHGRRAISEMTAAMVVPTVAAAGLHGISVIPAERLMRVAHLSMFPAMLLLMLYRYQQCAS